MTRRTVRTARSPIFIPIDSHSRSEKEIDGGFRIELSEGADGCALISPHVVHHTALTITLKPTNVQATGVRLAALFRDWNAGGRVSHAAATLREGHYVIALPVGATALLGRRNVDLVYTDASGHAAREVLRLVVRTASPQKRALLIGATYRHPIKLLEGPVHDVARMQAVVRHALGFGLVDTLAGAEATKEAILDRIGRAKSWCGSQRSVLLCEMR